MRQPRRLNTLTAQAIGDWQGVYRFFDSMGIEVKKKALQAQWDICKQLKRVVVGHILAQDLPWEKLAPATRRNKTENKDMIYIDSETYLNNIKVWKHNGQAFVGVKKGTTYKRKSGNVSLERVAIWMEFGTSKMPARPLWGPSIEELGGPKGMRDFVADAIYRRLKWLAKGKPIKVTRKSISNKIGKWR